MRHRWQLRGCPLRETPADSESCRLQKATGGGHRAAAEAVDCRKSLAAAAVADLQEATGGGGGSCQLQEEEKLSSFLTHVQLERDRKKRSAFTARSIGVELQKRGEATWVPS
jgi:hypothetical protein